MPFLRSVLSTTLSSPESLASSVCDCDVCVVGCVDFSGESLVRCLLKSRCVLLPRSALTVVDEKTEAYSSDSELVPRFRLCDFEPPLRAFDSSRTFARMASS